MRLIDADHLLNEIEALKKSPWFNYGSNSFDPLIRGRHLAINETVGMVVDLCIKQEPTIEPKRGWVSVKDRLPDNANHPGSFCPRYIVYTDYGITEGWYNPDSGCWYGFLTFMTEEYSRWNIDLKRGDVPKTVKNLPVRYWMPFPEPPKMEGGETDD